MRTELFEELLESVREGGAILREEKAATREARFEAPDVAAIREEYGLSQAKFAAQRMAPKYFSPSGLPLTFHRRGSRV